MFLTNKKVKIITDGHKNLEREIKTGILQGSLISPILFFIYISGVFKAIMAKILRVIFMLFMDNLQFLASGNLTQKMAISLETAKKTAL